MQWILEARKVIESRLDRFLEHKRARAEHLAAESRVLVESIADMVMRPAKRLRPPLLVASYAAVSSQRDCEPVGDMMVALELLHTYMLIHDDWMDMDDMRRGRRSVHRLMQDRYADPHRGESVAILAGDLACSYAWALLASSELPPRKLPELVRAFGEMQERVAAGQLLDLIGHRDVDNVHWLKTASYSIIGPLQIGGILGDATEAQMAALLRCGALVGQAFQIRDDILGLYGDPRATGKPVGGDLRLGRHTALIEEGLRVLTGPRRAVFEGCIGKVTLSDEDLEAVREMLERTGVRKRLESQVRSHLDQAMTLIQGAPFAPHDIDVVCTLARLAVYRDK